MVTKAQCFIYRTEVLKLELLHKIIIVIKQNRKIAIVESINQVLENWFRELKKEAIAI
jgi:hypothetical protein